MTTQLECRLPFQSPLDQAWLQLWVHHYGPDSRLKQYLRDPLPDDGPRAFRGEPPRPLRQGDISRPEPPRLKRVPAQPISETALPDWAQQLIGDRLIEKITLNDLLASIDDYFNTFKEMKRVNRAAYRYFKRVGAPIATLNSAVWRKHAEAIRFPQSDKLPSYFGAFYARTKEMAHKFIVEDDIDVPDFVWFEKLNNAATTAPRGSTIFSCNQAYFKRNGVLSPDEERRAPWSRRNLGIFWYIGVAPDGFVHALPMHMQHTQRLPRSDRKVPGGGSRIAYVHRSSFAIPKGLYELGDGDPHAWVRRAFCLSVAFTATASSGLQVTLQKDRVTARVGIPIANAATFFADRERADGGGRRAAILHLRRPHKRHLPDGRVTEVGAYLAGTRQFSWRGYQISIGVPGLHYPAPEGFTEGVYDLEGELPQEDMSDVTELGTVMAQQLWKPRKTRFERGKPTSTWAGNSFPLPDDAA